MTKPASPARRSSVSRAPHAGRRLAKATTSAKTQKPAASRRSAAADTASSYHHGALHEALLTAAERILERDGVGGLTLRAAAREAGVSHAAPTHHFGDLAGLVSELAAIGFRRFGAALAQAAEAAGPDAGRRLDAMGHAYVAFATAHPGLFTLMFRSERLDHSRPALQEAMAAAGAALAGAISARRGEPTGGPTPLAVVAETVRAWSLVHGFAVLLLDGRLDGTLKRLPSGIGARELLDAVLQGSMRA